MRSKNIEKRSFGYFLLRAWVGFWHNNFFYRKIVVINRENIPEKGHLIFTPNHQNALMDAMALVCTLTSQPIFMARSDIFKNPIIASILTFLKILPIYRIRDGYDSLKKNDEIFQKTMDVIRNQNGLVILPEGNHAGFRSLRQLKKGFARISFQAEKAEDFTLDMKIVPIGLDYSCYDEYRSDLFINFGKPVPVSDFYDAYKENPVKAINQIKAALSEHMKPLMIHIGSEKYYYLNDFLREFYREKICAQEKYPSTDYPYRFYADKMLISALSGYEEKYPDEIVKLNDKVDSYRNKLRVLKLETGQLNHPTKSPWYFLLRILFLVVTFPVFLYGWLNNILPYYLPIKLARKLKDRQFHSSFKFVLSLLFFPIFHIIQSLILRLFAPGWTIPLLYFVTLPFLGAFAYMYAQIFNKMVKEFRYLKARRKTEAFEELKEMHEELTDETGRIVKMAVENQGG